MLLVQRPHLEVQVQSLNIHSPRSTSPPLLKQAGGANDILLNRANLINNKMSIVSCITVKKGMRLWLNCAFFLLLLKGLDHYQRFIFQTVYKNTFSTVMI